MQIRGLRLLQKSQVYKEFLIISGTRKGFTQRGVSHTVLNVSFLLQQKGIMSRKGFLPEKYDHGLEKRTEICFKVTTEVLNSVLHSHNFVTCMGGLVRLAGAANATQIPALLVKFIKNKNS